jgi:hypothetical protein
MKPGTISESNHNRLRKALNLVSVCNVSFIPAVLRGRKMPERTNHKVFRAVGSVTSRDVVPISSLSLRHKRYFLPINAGVAEMYSSFGMGKIFKVRLTLHQRLTRCHCELVSEDYGNVPPTQ